MESNANTIKSSINVFKNASDDDIANATAMATLQTDADNITNDAARTSAIICYARHLLYVQWFDGNGGVTAANTFGNSNTISNPNETDDGWLKQYKNIAQQYGQSMDSGEIISYES